MKHFNGIVVPLLAITVLYTALPAHACSAVSCLGNGVEVRPIFTVTVKHESTPLAGVTVEVTSNRSGEDSVIAFSGVTASDGSIQVSLPPGDYWIRADLLSVNAAYHCFHVGQTPSRKAKRSLKYEWGDLAPATKRVAGRLIDSQPGKGGTSIWNLVHRVQVPISGALLTLRSPFTGRTYHATSDSEGMFSLSQIPNGIYVLHIEGGKAGEREYEGTDQLLAVSAKANRDSLLFVRRDAGAGSCGGTSLELVAQVR